MQLSCLHLFWRNSPMAFVVIFVISLQQCALKIKCVRLRVITVTSLVFTRLVHHLLPCVSLVKTHVFNCNMIYLIRYDSVYLTCSKKLTGSQLSLPQCDVHCLLDMTSHCVPCKLNHTDHGRPVGHEFLKYLPWFLEDNPGVTCPKGLVVLIHILQLHICVLWPVISL